MLGKFGVRPDSRAPGEIIVGVNIHYSPKRNRKYVRRFDHYEAQERFRNGESALKLAQEYGVSPSRIYQVASPTHRANHLAYQESLKCKGKCARCGKPTNYIAQRLGAKLCIRCSADDRITTVLPNSIRCGQCKQWLPDDAFGLSKSAKSHHRGRNHDCKKCVARARRERRHRAFAEGRARTLS